MDLLKYDGCINTFSGSKLSFIEPKPEQINVLDIARGLAFKAHFGGQTKNYFSIAQHSILVCDLMPLTLRNNPAMCLVALFHDASEAYTGDMVKPLKNLLPEFKVIEDRITKVIFEKLGLDLELLKIVKPYDIEAQKIEYSNFYGDMNTLYYQNPIRSNDAFLERFDFYTAKLQRGLIQEPRNL